jgi:hypothetical protein
MMQNIAEGESLCENSWEKCMSVGDEGRVIVKGENNCMDIGIYYERSGQCGGRDVGKKK